MRATVILGKFKRTNSMMLVGLFFAVVSLNAFLQPRTAEAATGINQQINFQGKVVNPDGTNIPNGTYNIEFKIYQDGNGVLGGGDETLKWTESRLRNNSQGVTITDGIFQVNLGSVNTALGTAVDFNQDTLWLSINLGNTNATCTPFSGCSPDGEMNPFIRFTSAPYALNSGKLSGLTSSQFVQLAQGVQVDASSASSIFINKTGASGNLLELQRAGTDVLAVDNNGTATLQAAAGNNATLTVKQASTATSGDIFSVTGSNGTSKFIQVTSTAANQGSVIVQSLGSNTLTVDSGSGTLVVGTTTTTIQKSGAALTIDLATAAASTLTITNSNASNTASLSVEGGGSFGGNVLVKTDSASAFQVQTSGSTNLFNIDSTTGDITSNHGTLTVNGANNPTNVVISGSPSGGTLAASTTFAYRVAATDISGSITQAVAGTPTSYTSGAGPNNNQVAVSWSAGTGAQSYRIYRTTNGGTNWFVNTVSSATTSINDNGTNFTWSTAGTPPTTNATGGVTLAGGTPLIFNGNGGTVTLQPSISVTSSYGLSLPTGQGGVNTVLLNDGSGNLTWVGTAGCSTCVAT
ncbi:MAG TPA: hypothetical protein VF272_00180, partial [Candidatus Saccharimonadia bacterium]